MTRFQLLLSHAGALLASAEWEALAVHVRHGAQGVSSRAEGWQWRRLIDRVPAGQRQAGHWPHALAWVAYRVADRALLAQALEDAPVPFAAFGAFLASLDGHWERVLTLTAIPEQASADSAVAARFRACALAELGQPGWQAAFQGAQRQVSGRDRGVLGLEYAYYLILAGQEGAARDVLAGALPDLRADPWTLTLAQANLGISCLRLNELDEAERALRRAVVSGRHPDGHAHLSTAWRGLGGLYLRLGQPARAAHAYELAQTKADNDHDRLQAMRSAALVDRLEGRLNDAMTLLHGVLLHGVPGHGQVAEGQAHPVYADLAALRLLAGDRVGAQAALQLVPPGSLEDGWRAGVVRAELQRLDGQDGVAGQLRALEIPAAWARQEAWVFPSLFALIGVTEPRPAWEATVRLDGPVQVLMNGLKVPLKPARPAAALLALLALHGGRVSAERALEALGLPGKNPRARRQELSRTVRELWEALGWRGAVTFDDALVTLSTDLQWKVVLPPPGRPETFCEGRYDDWIMEWRDERMTLSIPDSI